MSFLAISEYLLLKVSTSFIPRILSKSNKSTPQLLLQETFEHIEKFISFVLDIRNGSLAHTCECKKTTRLHSCGEQRV